MGLLGHVLLFPLAPVRGVVALAEVIQRQAEQELYSPAATRRQLEELDEKRRRGEISAEEEEQAQEEILGTRVTAKAVPDSADERPPESG